jgi:hypothetical protein
MVDISKYYYDPKTGFTSAEKLYKKLVKVDPEVTMKQVKTFIKNQFTAQVNKPIHKPKEFSNIVSPSVGNNFQIDIIVYDRYAYNKYKYILCCLDVYSRYASCRAMTNRNMSTIMNNVESIFEEMGEPNHINCDNEFNKNEFNKMAKEKGITMHYSQPDEINKNSIVERFNRTLAELIQKWRTATGKYDWYKVLPDIVANYNNTYHSTIKTTPSAVFNKDELPQIRIKKVKHSFNIGDQVRLKIQKKIFDKGDVLKYSKDIYLISDIDKNRIYVKNIRTGNELNDYVKPYQIVPVGEIQYKETVEKEQEPIHKTTQQERRITRRMNIEGVEKTEQSLRRSARQRKPEAQLISSKGEKIVWDVIS